MCEFNRILLSIVIPTRNESNLANLCSALIKQKYKKLFEVVIIDESDPNYRDMVIECIEDLKRGGVNVKSVFNEKRRGVGYSMIQGLLEASGEFILFLDADNEPHISLIEKLINEIMPSRDNAKEFIAVSFLSGAAYRSSLWNLLLLTSRNYLSYLQGALKYDKRYGFINVLKAWRRDVLLERVGTKIIEPSLSYLDDPIVNKKLNVLISMDAVKHINEVLVNDVRHLYEDYDLKFIYARIRWYTRGAFKLLRSKELSFKDKFRSFSRIFSYIVLLPLLPLTLYFTLALLNMNLLQMISIIAIFYIIFAASLLLCKSLRRKEALYIMFGLPMLLIANTMAVYLTIFDIFLNTIRKKQNFIYTTLKNYPCRVIDK